VAGEGQLHPGREDPHPPRLAILDEDRLAEAELGGDALARLLGDRAAIEEHAEGVAPLVLLVDEHAQDVELRHGAILCRRDPRFLEAQ
jgi:hypothetical protein